MVHNFQDSLKKSQEQADAPWWIDVYREAFPDLAATVNVRDDGWAQRGGIDRVLTLNSGKTLTVDEKVRAGDWPDFCLEYWSSYEHKTPGWVAKDLACDFIAYAFIPSATCYLLPFQTLRRSWRDNHKEWVKNYLPVKAKNKGYTTISVAVPIEIVMQSMADGMKVNWR